MSLLALVLVGAAVGLIAGVLHGARRRNVAPVRPIRPVRRVREDVPHLLYVYRRRAWPHRRIYGGISNEPEGRHARHLIDPDDRWWIVQTDGVMYPVRWLPNRTVARAAERALIREMHFAGDEPANYHHNPGRRRVRS